MGGCVVVVVVAAAPGVAVWGARGVVLKAMVV